MSEISRDGSGSRSVWPVLVLVAVAATVVLAVLLGMGRAAQRRAEEQRKAAERARASVPTVKVVRVGRRERLIEHVELSGTLRGAREVTVLPEVPGKLERVSVKRGQEVKAGEVLAIVESDTLRAGLEQAKAALSVAMSGARAARVARDNAASDRKRLRGLEKTGSASDREVEGAETMLKTAEAQVALAESQVEQAQAAVRLAQIQLKKAIISAPFAGTVADDFRHTAGAMVAPQVPIARIVEMQHLRIDPRASERDLVRLRDGQTAEISVASAPERTFQGVVLVAGPVVDPMTRTGPVEIALENVVEGGEYLLKPGMYADVEILIGDRNNVLAIEPESLTSHEGTDAVLTVRPANEVEVTFDPDKLEELGLSVDDVLNELAKGELEITAEQAAEARRARPPRIPVDSEMFGDFMATKVDAERGVQLREVAKMELVLSPDELRKRGLLASGVVESLRKARVEVPDESAAEAGAEHVLRVPGERDLSDRIAAVLLDGEKGIRVRDVAVVELRPLPDLYRIVPRSVEVGLRTREWVEVLETGDRGLSEGELIVASGVRALAPGEQVRMKSEADETGHGQVKSDTE
jgi:RND family efflux transporter MFP subunit